MGKHQGSDVVRTAPDAGSSPGEGEDVGQATARLPWRRLRLMSNAELAHRASAARRASSSSDFVDGLPFTMSLD